MARVLPLYETVCRCTSSLYREFWVSGVGYKESSILWWRMLNRRVACRGVRTVRQGASDCWCATRQQLLLQQPPLLRQPIRQRSVHMHAYMCSSASMQKLGALEAL